MNEWSANGFYSRSATTDHLPQTRIYRQYWEENWDQGKGAVAVKKMNGYRARDCQKPSIVGPQFVAEDVGIPPTYTTKKKKNGVSDPRFKRVLNSEARNDACAELDEEKTSLQKLNKALEEQINEDRILTEKVISYLKSPNEVALLESPSFRKFGPASNVRQQDLSEVVTKDVGFKTPMKFFADSNTTNYPPNGNFHDVPNFENYKDLKKPKTNSKTSLRRSASDCMLHTKNTLIEDKEENISLRIHPYPSATRIKKVHNWIKDFKMAPEKRRSVITVIGQTQTKPFSKILNEINQRRRLAKELDKHALCEAIMESAENPTDVKNLVAKVDFVLPDGKVIYSAEKVYLCNQNSKPPMDKDCGEYLQKSLDLLDANADALRQKCDMIPERDSSISHIGKRSKTRRTSKKLATPIKEKFYLKNKIKSIYTRNSSKILKFSLSLAFLVLCITGVYCTIKPPNVFMLSEFFKPKTIPWYEKLLF